MYAAAPVPSVNSGSIVGRGTDGGLGHWRCAFGRVRTPLSGTLCPPVRGPAAESARILNHCRAKSPSM